MTGVADANVYMCSGQRASKSLKDWWREPDVLYRLAPKQVSHYQE